MLTVISFGEAIVDLIADGQRTGLEDGQIFHRFPGGAPANVAVGIARLGGSSTFLGKLGSDSMGNFLIQTLKSHGVDTRGCIQDGQSRTLLAIVSLAQDGERSFEFYGEPGAHTAIRFEEIPKSIFSKGGIFHFGSLTLSNPGSRTTSLKAIETAKRQGMLVSFDPNLRLNLWENETLARERIEKVLPLVDLLKVSVEELEFLSKRSSTAEKISEMMSRGPGTVCLTLGKEGAELFHGQAHTQVKAPEVDAVDTTGAGDGFMAGLLFGVSAFGGLSPLSIGSNRETLLKLATHVGACVCTKKGAMSALPDQSEVQELEKFLRQK